jgi:biopolymer transport protein ExbD
LIHLKRYLSFFSILIICAVIAFQIPVSYASKHSDPKPKSSEFQLIIQNAKQIPTKYRHQLTQEFYRVYPQLVDKFNKNAPKTVYLKVDNKTEYGAYAMGHTISINYKAIQVDLDEGNLGVMIHELTHIVQDGYQGDVPSWIVEGMADYAVLLFGTEKTDVSLPKASEIKSGKKYLEKESYRHVTRFLLWVKTHKRATIFEDINAAAMAGTYKESLFKKWTGQTLEQLTQAYDKNPGSFEKNSQCFAQRNDCPDVVPIEIYHQVKISKGKAVNLRSKPFKDAKTVGSIKNSEVVTIKCQTTGDLVGKSSKKTKLWSYVQIGNKKGYLSHIYLPDINKTNIKDIPKCKKK